MFEFIPTNSRFLKYPISNSRGRFFLIQSYPLPKNEQLCASDPNTTFFPPNSIYFFIILYDGNGSVQSLEIEEVLISNKIYFFIISSRIELIVFSGISHLSKYLRGKSKWAMA